MKVMAIQMPIKDGDVEANKLKVEQLLDLHSGADLYLLPELWSSGFFYFILYFSFLGIW